MHGTGGTVARHRQRRARRPIAGNRVVNDVPRRVGLVLPLAVRLTGRRAPADDVDPPVVDEVDRLGLGRGQRRRRLPGARARIADVPYLGAHLPAAATAEREARKRVERIAQAGEPEMMACSRQRGAGAPRTGRRVVDADGVAGAESVRTRRQPAGVDEQRRPVHGVQRRIDLLHRRRHIGEKRPRGVRCHGVRRRATGQRQRNRYGNGVAAELAACLHGWPPGAALAELYRLDNKKPRPKPGSKGDRRESGETAHRSVEGIEVR